MSHCDHSHTTKDDYTSDGKLTSSAHHTTTKTTTSGLASEPPPPPPTTTASSEDHNSSSSSEQFTIAADLTLYANPLRCLRKTARAIPEQLQTSGPDMVAADLVKYGSPLDDKRPGNN
ncbi:hypothetical protein ACOMHN_056967 [Nucella lapillus]